MPTEPPDLLAQAMQSLYAVGPDEFMAARTQAVAAARAVADKEAAAEIGKLRKPSLAAWAVNITARAEPDVVAELVDLGARMRAAQGRLDTATLTSMRPERDRVVEAFVKAAVRSAEELGRSLSPAVQGEVRGTAIAALADERAAAAVSSGQLTRALSYSGFGEVDVSEAVARTASGAILTVVRGTGGSAASGGVRGTGRAAGRGAAADEGEGGAAEPDSGELVEDGAENAAPVDLADLEAQLRAAEKQLAKAEAEVTRARERAEDTRERLAVVERQLAKAREADERALEAVTDAVRARKAAEADRHTAEEALRAARKGADG